VGLTQQREEGFVSAFTEACAVLFCTMETHVSVSAVEAVKDEVVEVTQIISPLECEVDFFQLSAHSVQ